VIATAQSLAQRVEDQLTQVYIELLFAKRQVEKLENRIDRLEAMKLALASLTQENDVPIDFCE
jgi:hypothetical protein